MADKALYKVAKDPSGTGKYIIAVATTGKMAHGTGLYADRSTAETICANKNRGK
jgi:hypothetical protein